jgi:hypothetical protein
MTSPLAGPNGSGPHRVRLVVTCSDRKRLPVPPRLQLRDVPPGPAEVRCRAWMERLERVDAPAVVAADVYCGDHWYVARSMPALIPGVELWVASAGYGLIPPGARIKAYAATFARRHVDSVGVESVDSGATWWECLTRWEGPMAGWPRSLGQLAAMDPKLPILVVASAAYTDALAPDILGARGVLGDDELLAVISVGVPTSSRVRDVMIHADARLQAELGGARQSLNVRLARRLLATTGGAMRLTSLRAAAHQLMEAAPPSPRYNRTQKSDAEVGRYIAAELHRSPGTSCTRLLRRYRNQGFACEQQRFRALFEQSMEDATDA